MISVSTSEAVLSLHVSLAPPPKYSFSTVASPIRPKRLLIPKRVIMLVAILVACSISLAAPVVTLPKTISSAARPPSRLTSLSCSSASVCKYFSSSGTCMTYPKAPMVLGTMVIFCTGSEFFCRALISAWPTSW